MNKLTEKHCVACEGGIPPLQKNEIDKLLSQIDGWEINESQNEISRRFEFKNFHHVMGFANAIAWIANQQGHHPDLELGYNYCLVRYTTHAIQGLSENDFICAAKINTLR